VIPAQLKRHFGDQREARSVPGPGAPSAGHGQTLCRLRAARPKPRKLLPGGGVGLVAMADSGERCWSVLTTCGPGRGAANPTRLHPLGCGEASTGPAAARNI